MSDHPGYCENDPEAMVQITNQTSYPCYAVEPSDCFLDTLEGDKVWETCQTQYICPLAIDSCDSEAPFAETCAQLAETNGTSFFTSRLSTEPGFYFQKGVAYCP